MNGGNYELESQIALIFSEVLRIPVDFDRSKSFVQLGGQSISAARLQIRFIETFRVRVPFASIFYKGTVSEMAEVIFQLSHKGVEF